MRLGRLDLTRYGHFTNRSFDLSADEADFHIIFGPNEAGKSTALAAIEDLLFGIQPNSPYNFQHDYASMRIGAVLQQGSASLEMLRRKGRKDTILAPDGSPLPGGDTVLMPYLSGADRTFFERMFCLDHVRLEHGGREILNSKDDVGQMLFSAGAGIGGLRDRLGELDNEADELWSARRAKHRKFYIADDKLSEAQKALREHTLTANNWRDLKQTYEETEEAHAGIVENIKECTANLNRLNRIRRVLRDVRRKQELDSQLVAMEDVAALPEDAAQVAEEAERKDAEAATRIATLQQQLQRTEDSLEELIFDETFVQRADDIRQLHERRIEVRSEKADLPKREAELNAAEQELLADARELAWSETDTDELINRIPERTKATAVRELLNRRGETEAEVANKARSLKDAQERRDELEEQLDKTGSPPDVSNLAIAIKTVREQGDIPTRVRNAENALKEVQERLKRRLETLNPIVPDRRALIAMKVPAHSEVQSYRDRKEDWKRRIREMKQKIESLQQEEEAAGAALERTMQDEHVVTLEALNEARRRRDALWELVKFKYLNGEPVAGDHVRHIEEEIEDLPGAFGPAIEKADQLADSRFDHAEAAGRVAEINRNVGELQTQLKHARENETKAIEEGEQLESEWLSMWGTAPFEPLAPEIMLEWLHAREDVLEVIDQQADSEITLTARRGEERAAREQTLNELVSLGVDVATMGKDGLNVIIERAADEQRRQESAAARKIKLADSVQVTKKEVARLEQNFHEVKESLDEWKVNWNDALVRLGLSEDTAAEAVSSQIDTIDRMRETAGRIRSLKHDRIDKIRLDITDFEQVVEKIAADLAEDLKGQPAEDTVLELERRMDNAVHIQGLRQKTFEEVSDLKMQIRELEDDRRELAASVSHLKNQAVVETKEALFAAIERSDQQRSLTQERESITEKLHLDGDGRSVEDLEDECKDVLIDQVTAEETSLQSKLEDLHTQQTAAAENRSIARKAFQDIGGGDAAAQAAADKEEALAEMREVAERYTRVQTSAILLRWAIERYRREKQAPLLKRAGALFELMTEGSFASLQVAFDDQDNAYLTGVRPDGSNVSVSGMSSGTEDQLFLALRVAAIEDYLERADAMPFVADDLFINFDDARSTAGFKLLGELSQKTQVLFFTHHQHLVDIGHETLDKALNVVRINDDDVTAS